jgi:hypothetical protein
MLALLLSSELPWLLSGRVLFGVAVAGFVAWSVAHFVMVWHQDASGAISSDDRAEWEAREDTKPGGLVPFTYLLASPEQRRILQYLGQESRTKRPRHWYTRR